MKTTIANIEQEVEIDATPDPIIETHEVGQVVRAYPAKILVGGEWVENTEGEGEYIRLQFGDGTSWKWNAPLDDYSEAVSVDPDDLDPRWKAE